MLDIFKRSRTPEKRRWFAGFHDGSLQAKLRIGLIPLLVIVLILTGFITYRFYVAFIREALNRTARLQINALAHDVEEFLATCSQDLRLIAKIGQDPAKLRNMFANLIETSSIEYRELAFISQKTDDHLFLFVHEKKIYQTHPEHIEQIIPDPLSFYEQLMNLPPGQVWVSSVLKIDYPIFSAEHPNQKLISWIIYFGTHFAETTSGQSGYLLLAVDARNLRNLLSRHRAESRLIWPYSQGLGKGSSYLFDAEGWMLFESEDEKLPDADLGTDLSRAGYTGTLGNENLAAAFRPDSEFEDYWKMLAEIRKNRSGVLWRRGSHDHPSIFGERFLAYAPIMLPRDAGVEPVVYGGVAVSERSRLIEIAVFKQVDVIFILILATVLVVFTLIGILGRTITRPIFQLVAALERIHRTGVVAPIDVPGNGREIRALQASINTVLTDVQHQSIARRIADKEQETAAILDTTPVDEADLIQLGGGREADDTPEIMGSGPNFEKLKQAILRAARADADVLIIGETGTGKQLAAEAIHRNSHRADKPFVAINCGELDENLLLDTLFGHIKGAFTEAKTPRKGAFIEADGGILFLDEIQTASAHVQQALLRAVAHRKIKALGSDRETDVDVRLIAATNADLTELVQQGRFRQDLYFRFKVITIYTPPLRDQPESIPLLVGHYFLKAKTMAHKEKLSLTRGTLEKMTRYSWPGNVRELINCITRAVVMTEGQVIHAEDILLEGDQALHGQPPAERLRPGQPVFADRTDSSAASIAARYGLNARQAKIYPQIMRGTGVTRRQYQALLEQEISSRTALYDLQNFVDKGLLKKIGLGPATRYVPCFMGSSELEGQDAKNQQ